MKTSVHIRKLEAQEYAALKKGTDLVTVPFCNDTDRVWRKKKIDSALLLLFAFIVGSSGTSTPSAKAQTIFMEPSQNKDPAYAQLDLANRMNQWNIRQLGFQIVGNARFQKRGKPMSQAQINRIVQDAKKLKRYNSAASITKYKDSGKSIVPARLLQSVALDDINKRLAIGLMEKSLTAYLTTSMHDGFESNDLAWATVYFLEMSYLVSRDSGRPDKSSTQFASISPELSFKIYREIQNSLSNNPKIRKMTDVQKQMAAENLVIMAGTNAMLYAELIDPMSMSNLGDGLYGPKTAAADKEKRIVTVKQQAKRNLEQVFAVPAAKIQITGNGVVFK